MSRRPPNPAADRAAQNQQTLKTLVKVESNKACADCKRNKHPRWASWNLGVFVCIRCSGIHRGMGTHVSRVKSVDLDAWTDEQMQSMLRWGNARANKYWEAKLAPGHIPAEAKIENFIRTKYESKRWVMDGGMPDPSTLDSGEGDDNIPLNVVQEKAKMERSASQRASSTASQPLPNMKQPPQDVDLFGDMSESTPSQRSNSAAPAPARTFQPPPSSTTSSPKPSKTGDSLLGFDFFGPSASNPPARPSSAAASAASSGLPSRPDLKQSILSLYSRPSENSSHSRSVSASTSSTRRPSQSASNGLDDAFSGLEFTTQPQSPPVTSSSKPAPFSNLTSPTFKPSLPISSSSSSTRPPSIGTGKFFDAKPAATQPKPAEPPKSQGPRQQRGPSSSSGFGDFGDFTSPEPPKPTPPVQSSSTNGMGDLFNVASPPPQPVPARPVPLSTSISQPAPSPFNLSAAKPAPAPQPPPQTSSNNAIGGNTSSTVNLDPWGSDNIWAASNTAPAATASAPAPPPPAPKQAQKPPPATLTDFGGWNTGSGTSGALSAPAPKVKADEDFGGWESGTPSVANTSNSTASKPAGGLGGSEDLFSNVWE